MVILQRLSTGPTIPDLRRAETDVVIALWNERYVAPTLDESRAFSRLAAMKIDFGSASAVLGAAILLMRAGLIAPRSAVGAFGLTSHLSRKGLMLWRRHRRAARERRWK